MAIPFNLPEEQAEDQRIIRIRIYELLRQLIQPEILNQGSQDDQRMEGPLVLVFPNIVHRTCNVRKPAVPPRRRRRRQEKHVEEHQPQHTLNLGIELRQIEEYTYTQPIGQIKKKRRETKSSSFFSLLIPTPIPGSIWTTVIILVGWRILTRQR